MRLNQRNHKEQIRYVKIQILTYVIVGLLTVAAIIGVGVFQVFFRPVT